jgi:flagellar basal-body rod modification protein FlgD
MEISAASSNLSQINNVVTPTERDTKNKNLSSKDFLELLVTQMTNQDPLEPMNDKEFMAQMAQFSSLEEMSGLNKTMSGFVKGQQMIGANSYLGQDVTILGDGGAQVDGQVTAISSANQEGKVRVTVNNAEYDVAQIQSVRLAGNKSPAAAPVKVAN